MKPHPDLDFHPPSKEFAQQFITPFKNYFHPEFFGLDELDTSRPAMYVSNHAVLGVLDVYPFAIELYLRKGIVLRALADSNHFKIPLWRDFLTKRIGVLEASRANCAAVMERNENLVVYPGGTREVCKKKGEQYELKWSDRSGFTRMAMQYGYDIIPVAAVGAEEAFTIVKDANEILNETVFGKFLKFSGLAHTVFKDGDLLPPLVSGIGGTVLPKPVKLSFSFGQRIATGHLQPYYDDADAQELIKSKVQLSLYQQFAQLFEQRK
ncbi:MAG: lysophospholipid acyltransferase family protein [Chitinophagales bacterium]